MRALLDTHTFIWATTDDERVSPVAREIIAEGGNDLFLSAASVWEIAIKFGQGRLDLPGTPSEYVPQRMILFGLDPLPVGFHHAYQVSLLPPIHKDPFDRLLIAQAQVENLPIITSDPHFARYGIEVIW